MLLRTAGGSAWLFAGFDFAAAQADTASMPKERAMTTRLLSFLLCLLILAGCAAPRALPPPSADLFHDQVFRSPITPVDASQLFTLSAPMQDYLRSTYFTSQVRQHGPQRGLVDALYKKGDLKLEYDSSATRTAADTYQAGMGNCLSLVIMTAAFAKQLGLTVNFQQVLLDQQWSRNGSIFFSSIHVNLSLETPRDSRIYHMNGGALTVDFIPSEEAAKQLVLPLEENEIVAMYMNNRAAEFMAQNQTDEAYWWARAAIAQNPRFLAAYNTLGVVYQRHGKPELAEQVYRRALERSPEDTIVLHNLIPVLAMLGKNQESKLLAARLASIEPTPPFHYFQQGIKAMQAGKYNDAKNLFAREVRRSPFYHEFHFWLGVAHWRLGNASAASEEFTQAMNTSTTAKSTELYSAKLAYLRSLSSAENKVSN